MKSICYIKRIASIMRSVKTNNTIEVCGTRERVRAQYYNIIPCYYILLFLYFSVVRSKAFLINRTLRDPRPRPNAQATPCRSCIPVFPVLDRRSRSLSARFPRKTIIILSLYHMCYYYYHHRHHRLRIIA